VFLSKRWRNELRGQPMSIQVLVYFVMFLMCASAMLFAQRWSPGMPTYPNFILVGAAAGVFSALVAFYFLPKLLRAIGLLQQKD
jgi:hypothetical protein